MTPPVIPPPPPPTREELIQKAISTFKDPENKLTLTEIARTLNVPLTTVKGRMKGIIPRSQSNADGQILSPMQESILEKQIINLAQDGVKPTSAMVCELAGKVIRMSYPTVRNPSKSWLIGFLKRSTYCVRSSTKGIEIPNLATIDINKIPTETEGLTAAIDAFPKFDTWRAERMSLLRKPKDVLMSRLELLRREHNETCARIVMSEHKHEHMKAQLAKIREEEAEWVRLNGEDPEQLIQDRLSTDELSPAPVVLVESESKKPEDPNDG